MDYGFSIGGPVGQPGGAEQAVLLLQPRSQPAHVRRRRQPLPRADAARAPGRLLAVARQPRQPLSLHQGSARSPAPARPPTPAPASRTAACSAGFRRAASIRRGLNILKWWPTPNIAQPRRPGVQLRERRPRGRTSSAISRSSASTTSRRRTLRGSFKFLEYQQPSKVHPGTIPGFNDTQEHDYGIWLPAGTFNWTISPTMFVEASFGANFHHQEGCSVTGGEPNYCRTGLQRDVVGQPQSVRLRRHSLPVPERDGARPEHVHLLGPQPGRHDDVGRHADPGAAAVRLGHARRQPAAPERRARSAPTRASPAAPTSSSTRATGPGTPA